MITKFDEIQQIIEQFNPVKYSSDRNFIDGSVSKLSPYISRGFISTKYIYNILISKGFQFNQIEKFTQEMIWREFLAKKNGKLMTLIKILNINKKMSLDMEYLRLFPKKKPK